MHGLGGVSTPALGPSCRAPRQQRRRQLRVPHSSLPAAPGWQQRVTQQVPSFLPWRRSLLRLVTVRHRVLRPRCRRPRLRHPGGAGLGLRPWRGLSLVRRPPCRRGRRPGSRLSGLRTRRIELSCARPRPTRRWWLSCRPLRQQGFRWRFFVTSWRGLIVLESRLPSGPTMHSSKSCRLGPLRRPRRLLKFFSWHRRPQMCPPLAPFGQGASARRLRSRFRPRGRSRTKLHHRGSAQRRSGTVGSPGWSKSPS